MQPRVDELGHQRVNGRRQVNWLRRHNLLLLAILLALLTILCTQSILRQPREQVRSTVFASRRLNALFTLVEDTVKVVAQTKARLGAVIFGEEWHAIAARATVFWAGRIKWSGGRTWAGDIVWNDGRA